MGNGVLFHGHLFDAAFMASSVKWSVQESVYNGKRKRRLDESRRQYEHVGVVVGACEACKLYGPADSRAYALMLVKGHADAVAAAADAYAGVIPSFFYRKRAGVGKIGVVATLFTETSKVL